MATNFQQEAVKSRNLVLFCTRDDWTRAQKFSFSKDGKELRKVPFKYVVMVEVLPKPLPAPLPAPEAPPAPTPRATLNSFQPPDSTKRLVAPASFPRSTTTNTHRGLNMNERELERNELKTAEPRVQRYETEWERKEQTTGSHAQSKYESGGKFKGALGRDQEPFGPMGSQMGSRVSSRDMNLCIPHPRGDVQPIRTQPGHVTQMAQSDSLHYPTNVAYGSETADGDVLHNAIPHKRPWQGECAVRPAKRAVTETREPSPWSPPLPVRHEWSQMQGGRQHNTKAQVQPEMEHHAPVARHQTPSKGIAEYILETPRAIFRSLFRR